MVMMVRLMWMVVCVRHNSRMQLPYILMMLNRRVMLRRLLVMLLLLLQLVVVVVVGVVLMLMWMMLWCGVRSTSTVMLVAAMVRVTIDRIFGRGGITTIHRTAWIDQLLGRVW